MKMNNILLPCVTLCILIIIYFRKNLLMFWRCKCPFNKSSLIRNNFFILLLPLCLLYKYIFFFFDSLLKKPKTIQAITSNLVDFTTISIALMALTFSLFSFSFLTKRHCGNLVYLNFISINDFKEKSRIEITNKLNEKYCITKISFHFMHHRNIEFFPIYETNTFNMLSLNELSSITVKLKNLSLLINDKTKEIYLSSIEKSIKNNNYYIVLHTQSGNIRCIKRPRLRRWNFTENESILSKSKKLT